jgi:hypothetical protein
MSQDPNRPSAEDPGSLVDMVWSNLVENDRDDGDREDEEHYESQ